MDELRLSRRTWLRATAALGVSAATPAWAIMAGAPPDTPAARVDANVSSSPWSGAVAVISNGSAYSGVVIGPRHVLTAAHVAGGQLPANLQVVFNTTATPQTRSVASVATYPGTVFPYDDLSLLTLAQDVPPGTAVYPIVDEALATGTVITLVGYGSSGSGASGPTVAGSSSVKRVGRNVVDQYTSQLDASGRTSPFYLYDFDGPAGAGPLGGPSLGNASETGVAGGDSGSGAFVDTPAGPALFGLSTVVLSFGASGATSIFGSGGGGLVLSHGPYLAWLRAQTQGNLVTVSEVRRVDAPVAPTWAMALLAVALGTSLTRRRDADRG